MKDNAYRQDLANQVDCLPRMVLIILCQ